MSTVKVRIPTALRAYAGGRAALELPVAEAATVERALARLVAAEPALAAHLFDERGALRSFVNVFVNNEDVRALGNGSTPLAAGDVVVIVPSVAGGAA